jgi:hypothetical protein
MSVSTEAIPEGPTAHKNRLVRWLEHLCLGFCRAILVLLCFGIAIAAGLLIPELLRDQITQWRPAGLAFGAATVLSVLKELLEALPVAWSFVVNAVTDSLPKLFAQVAVATLGLGFAYYAAVSGSTSERSLNLRVTGPLPPVILNESDAVLTSYVTFPQWKSEFPTGDPQPPLVYGLVDSLLTCIQDPSDSVTVVVRAYASSEGSDKVNDDLYKNRTKFVADLISARVIEVAPDKASQFHVERRIWGSLEIMKIRRLFKDTDSKGTYLTAAGSLNRRAEIQVKAAGSCLPT